MTGFRDQNLSKVLNELGYDANSNNTLTKDSALLIIPTENHQSSKVTKAQKYGIKIMDVQTVWNLINTNEIQNVIWQIFPVINYNKLNLKVIIYYRIDI